VKANIIFPRFSLKSSIWPSFFYLNAMRKQLHLSLQPFKFIPGLQTRPQNEENAGQGGIVLWLRSLLNHRSWVSSEPRVPLTRRSSKVVFPLVAGHAAKRHRQKEFRSSAVTVKKTVEFSSDTVEDVTLSVLSGRLWLRKAVLSEASSHIF
jgi:hypothetical protein